MHHCKVLCCLRVVLSPGGSGCSGNVPHVYLWWYGFARAASAAAAACQVCISSKVDVLGPTARPIGGAARVCCFARCAACRLGADSTGQTSADSCGYVDVTWTCRVVLCVCCMLLSSVVFCVCWGDVRLLAPPMHCAMACSVLCVMLASPPTCHLLVHLHVL